MAEDLQSKATELMKKVLTAGVGAFFLTEESLRGLVSEFKLPKELLAAILESAGKMRGEFLKDLSKDLMNHVKGKVDPMALVEEFLSKNEIDLKVKIKFNPRK